MASAMRYFICPECKVTITAFKKSCRMPVFGHIKTMYCYVCKTNRDFIQVFDVITPENIASRAEWIYRLADEPCRFCLHQYGNIAKCVKRKNCQDGIQLWLTGERTVNNAN